MRWCPKYKINVDEGFNCNECIFNKGECEYKNWLPGLKKGREWGEKDIEEFNEGLDKFPQVHI